MTALPTPANVPQGWAVRVTAAGRVYSSGVLPKAEAKRLADDLARDVMTASQFHGFVPFTVADGHEVRLRARSVVVIDPSPLGAAAEVRR